MEELYKKTTWKGTQLDNEKTQWVAFPVVKLDGVTETIIISARQYEIGYLGSSAFGRGELPQQGVFLLTEHGPRVGGIDTLDTETTAQ